MSFMEELKGMNRLETIDWIILMAAIILLGIITYVIIVRLI